MKQAELEQIIDRARLEMWPKLSIYNKQVNFLPNSISSLSIIKILNLGCNQINNLPDGITNLSNLRELHISRNQLSTIPESIGSLTSLIFLNLNTNQIEQLPESIGELSNLERLFICNNQLKNLPESIGNLEKLVELHLNDNQLTDLPESINNIHSLTLLNLSKNKLKIYPDNISRFSRLKYLVLSDNQLTKLPDSICNLSNLSWLDINGNKIQDLSILQSLPCLETVGFLGIDLPRRYWIKLSEWNSQWLLDEDNTEIRRTLIKCLGYEKICHDLNAITTDTWREYTLLKIEETQNVYEDDEIIDREPMLLLKMNCPSTEHIHILRVPPEMTSAEAAITWVNHGIHPDEFAVQT